MLKFNCKNCGQKISVPEVHAGKKGKCPKCKAIVVVPEINDDIPLKLRDSDTDNLQYVPKPPEPELRLKRDTSPQTRYDGLSADGLNVTNEFLRKPESKEKPPERKLPWILDIFLYPTSVSGMIHLGVFSVGICLLGLFSTINLFCFMRLLSFILLCLFVGYTLYYLSDCVRDSAAGQIRAHDTLTQSSTPDRWECIGQVINVLACISICFGAVIAYFSVTKELDWIFGLLIISGVILFPMTLLSMVMFNSFSGLNPVLIISSIISTIFEYLGLLVLFYSFGVLVILMLRLFPIAIINVCIAIIMVIYFAMIACHLLGRFYYLNSKKLNWEV